MKINLTSPPHLGHPLPGAARIVAVSTNLAVAGTDSWLN